MEVSIAIVTKNIIVIAIIVARIIIIKLATSFKKEEILSSPIGSITIAHTLYTSMTDNIFITGIKHMPTKITRPTPPNTFFISCEEDNNMSTESDTNPPTTGIKFPTANLAVFTVNLSNDVTYKPCMDTSPKYKVNTAPNITTFICLINDDSLFNLILLVTLFTTKMAKDKDMATNINFLNIIFIAAIPPIKIGFNAVDVIGNPTKTKSEIIIGIITLTKPITFSIVV